MAPLPEPDAVCDGGDLDCGSGLLLIIRGAMAPLAGGGVLEVRSRERSVRVDLPAWCRLVHHELLGVADADDGGARFLIRKGAAPDGEFEEHRRAAREFSWSVRVRAREGAPAKAYARNHVLEIGQAASFDVSDAAPSAVEVFLCALGAELGAALRWRAGRAGLVVREVEISLKAKPDNVLHFLGLEDTGTPAIPRIEGRVFVDADADEAQLAALWEETLRRSPLVQTLLRSATVDLPLRRA